MREGLLGADEGAGVDRMVVKGNEDELVGRLEWVLQEKNGIKLRPKGLGGVLVRSSFNRYLRKSPFTEAQRFFLPFLSLPARTVPYRSHPSPAQPHQRSTPSNHS